MSLTQALVGVVGYDPALGREQPAQQHLATARSLVAVELPPLGYRVKVSGSGQTLPKVPWIAVLDQDVTKTAKQGTYVVYLYDVATKTVSLSMNQGATAHRDYYDKNRPTKGGIEAAALAELVAETKSIRQHLDPALLLGTVSDIDLGSTLFLPRAYEAGNIAAIEYRLDALPEESTLQADLQRFLVLYMEVVTARQAAIAAEPSKFNVAAEPPAEAAGQNLVFQPKSASDYFAWVKAHQQRRSRKHEELVNNFAKHAAAKGWKVGSKGVHPRDLVLDGEGTHLLIEAKTVRANSEFAVREAIGQLMTYEHLYYPAGGTNKVALFSAPVGDLWVDLLGKLDIECVWLDGAVWKSQGANVAWV